MAELTGPESIVNAERGLLRTLTAVAEGVPITEIERDDVRRLAQALRETSLRGGYYAPCYFSVEDVAGWLERVRDEDDEDDEV